ncbi:hypothetical protein ES332_A05G008000v1 [Gossypium tomentosum]|uniref:NB-ARC domain-containing protein n=1 Tax=Gossypium tomentosum TaxID=34277 RepID=A0A5D2QBX2_GOSTO|nr:hypothetical protein ES332_A05G008000v1 [Gossypium tomentosum]
MLNTKYGLHKWRNWAAKMYSGLPHAAMPRKVATKVKSIKKRMEEIDASIVGMAGVGKTTFAKVIYETSEQKFENRAWTFVPSKYRMRELLLGLLENLMSVREETLKLDNVKFAEKLRKLELGKRYLVVIDGVEKAQPVLLTTRSNCVALLASSSPIRTHHLQSLGGKERLELLEKLVFKDGSCQEHLVRLGTQIAAKCDELPLAIVSLAEVLAKGNNVASAEQFAERYLDELIDLCLIEVTRKRSDRVLKHSKSINFGATSGITKSERTRFLDVQMKLGGSIKGSLVLKYLRIKHPSLKRLPSSLCNPSDQQTLDIKNTCVKCLQCGIWEMQKLRHLSVPHQTTLPKCSDNAITPNRETAALIIHYRFLNLIKLTLNSLDMGKTKKCLLVKITLERTDLVADDVMRTLEKLGHLQQLWQLHDMHQIKVNSPSHCLKRELEQLRAEQRKVHIHF